MTRLRRAAYLASVHSLITVVAFACWACRCVLQCWARGWGWRQSVRWAWDSHRALWAIVRREAP